MVDMFCMLFNMISCICIINSCPLTEGVPPWNEDISSVSKEIARWLFKPDGEIPETSRYDKDRKFFTVGMFEGNIAVGLAWQSRSLRKMDGFLYGVVDHEGQFTGDDIAFIYPDFRTGLRGKLKELI